VIWELFALRAIPLWLIVAMLISILLIRRAFKQQSGLFDIVARAENAEKWPPAR
jgi:hypothetical protein